MNCDTKTGKQVRVVEEEYTIIERENPNIGFGLGFRVECIIYGSNIIDRAWCVPKHQNSKSLFNISIRSYI